MTPKITVFMAAYNAANYISESIESILAQTFIDFELLIVNDGSTDHTLDVISKFKDQRIRLLHNDRNRGLVYTRNIALTEARGEYIAILDSDDIATGDRLKSQYEFLIRNPQIALCGGHGAVINTQGQIINDSRLIVPIGPEQIKMTLLFLNTFVNSTVMYRTSIFKESGGYKDFAPAEDYELFTRISDKYPIANLDVILVKYRDHENNTSTIQAEIARIKLLEIKEKQLLSLGISANDSLTNTLFSILTWTFDDFKFSDYLSLLTTLKSANHRLKKYPIVDFDQMLFNYWFEIIYTKKAKMNALALLFNKNLFKWSYVNARQLRKAFKLSWIGIGTRSK